MTVGGFGDRMQLRLGPAQQRDQLFVDDLDDLLARREARQDLLTDSALLDPADEVLDDLEVDVGFEERQAHFAHGLFDVVLLKDTPAAELLENGL